MNQDTESTNARGSTHIAHLWEYPDLTLAFFGMQIHSEELYEEYAQTGIEEQIAKSLAQEPGVLCVRDFPEGSGGVQMQYWRSQRELAEYSKRMPHMAWWKWLVEHEGPGFSFYHEIYQCKTAEAVYQRGTIPVGAGSFCSVSSVELGSNRSRERQERFAAAQSSGVDVKAGGGGQ